jgi:hypothetical protein
MLTDNGWILEFDIHLAGTCLSRARVDCDRVSPEFIFDEGYATWNGFSPNELEQRLVERQEIIPLAEQNMSQYLDELKRWGSERVEKFREAGWRKALYS